MASRSTIQQVRVEAIHSGYAENSAVGNLARGGAIDANTTIGLSREAFQRGKFFRAFSSRGFRGLSATKLPSGDEIWSYERRIDGTPHKLTLQKSTILSTIRLNEVTSDEEIEAMAKKYRLEKSQTYIEFKGKKYFVRMDIPLHFGTGREPDVIMSMTVFIVADSVLGSAVAGVIAALGLDAFASALESLGNAVFTVLWSAVSGVMEITYAFFQAFVASLIEEGSIVAAYSAGAGAVGGAVEEGAFAAITVSALAYMLVGLLIIAIIFIIMEYVLHDTYQNVYVFNLTGYELELDFPYIDEGAPHNVVSTKLPKFQKRIGPGGVNLGSYYSGTAFRFQSDSEWHGLGYALGLTAKVPGSGKVHARMACMFDMPYFGDSSLNLTTVPPGSFERFFTESEGLHKVTHLSGTRGDLELVVTYDFLSGEHEDPGTRTQQYLYNSLVILRQIKRS